MKFLSEALTALCPNAIYTIRNDVIEWHDTEQTQPTQAEIDAKIAELQADFEAKSYQRVRAKAYPSIQDQLDMQYHDSINGTTTWADAIASVKNTYPKPE